MSKVVNFPTSNEQRFNSALLALKEGRAAHALQEAKELIDAGYPLAYALAGVACEKGGSDLKRNLDDARFYYQKAVEEVGTVEAWLALGRIYYFGIGVEPDYEKALYYYTSVYNETRIGLAAMMLARLYSEGKAGRVDLARAETYLKEAIEEGFAFASGQLALLEFRQGKYGKAIVHWLQGIWRACRLSKGDIRLRPY